AEFNAAEWGLSDPFINLAAGHHKPETPMQWIITEADRLASGIDREKYEERNHMADVAKFRVTRMLCPFEEIELPETEDKRKKFKSADDFKWRLPLREVSACALFPVLRAEAENETSATKEYGDLFFKFVAALEKLEHQDSLALWYEHFDSLYGIYAGLIPAATVDVLADVSLYDHSRAVAAFSAASYQYHQAKGTMTIDAIRDKEEKKYQLILGDFFGIQNFIFSEGGQTRRNAAKLLRGRSFYVSLLTELAADFLLRELGLPVTSLLINAAGKFAILAPNLEQVKTAIARVRKQVNDWVVKHFMGQASLGIVCIEAAPCDFENGRWSDLWNQASRALSAVKSRRIDLEAYGGVQHGFIEQFGEFGLCPFCGQRPGDSWVRVGVDNDKVACCGICADQMEMGRSLVRKETRYLAITEIDADLRKEG
ncbi:MAG TPA: type III-A CRISPR-associated protein Cas10/Csm1, partial [Candidatus Ozemobacteraceae bacterium]|nr:type III-A CRISPR-associated protein Cas10/Csm1 [Candidatus Ozemobacteraceae bacterium]